MHTIISTGILYLSKVFLLILIFTFVPFIGLELIVLKSSCRVLGTILLSIVYCISFKPNRFYKVGFDFIN